MAEEVKVAKREGQALVPERMESAPTFAPQVDIIEKDDCIVVLADMPGVSKDTVDVVLEDGVLTINGRVEETPAEGLQLRRREYEVGNYHRCFSLGEGLNTEAVEASMKDGVLRLVIPLAEQYKVRRIEIKTED